MRATSPCSPSSISPSGVSALPTGGFLIADTGNHRIAQVAFGVLTTVAGTGDAG